MPLPRFAPSPPEPLAGRRDVPKNHPADKE